MLNCHWKQTFGVECPGCGFQRSFLELISGDVYESLYLFPATVPVLLLFILLGLHLKFKFRHGAYALIGLFSLSSLLMLAGFIFKISV